MVRRSVRTGFIGTSALALALIGGAGAAASDAPAQTASEQGPACPAEAWFTRAIEWVEAIPSRVSDGYASTMDRARERLAGTLGVRMLAPKCEGEADEWVLPEDAGEAPERLVLLVHGLDDPGSIWDETAPALRSAGHRVARFNYANDQPIAKSADALGAALADLRARGVERVDIVAHSMGGLVARDVLTRCEHYAGDTTHCADLPVVDRLVTFGTPNAGSPLARLRGVMEIRDQWERIGTVESFDLADLLGFVVDGEGEAGRDLLPGSDFLKELNSRPLPADLRVLTVEGRALPVGPDDLRPYVESALARAVLREDGVAWVEGLIDAAAAALGDGAVPAGSVPLMGATEHAVLDADHRSMLKRVPAMAAVRSVFGAEDGPPPGIEFLLEYLGPAGAEEAEAGR